MPEAEILQAAEERYVAELSARRVGDVRPACRQLLKRLRVAEPDAYEAGVRRYEDELIPAIATGTVNPLDGWLAYGRWLADQLYDGRLVSVDETGRSADLDSELPAGAMAIYLAPRDDEPAVLLAAPAAPSEHQAATRDLLCR